MKYSNSRNRILKQSHIYKFPSNQRNYNFHHMLKMAHEHNKIYLLEMLLLFASFLQQTAYSSFYLKQTF